MTREQKVRKIMEKKKPISIALSQDSWTWLKLESLEQGISLSELIQRALSRQYRIPERTTRAAFVTAAQQGQLIANFKHPYISDDLITAYAQQTQLGRLDAIFILHSELMLCVKENSLRHWDTLVQSIHNGKTQSAKQTQE